jgi:putative alpha-1,2-mannosidase
MVKSATYAPYGGLGDYMKLGYVPIDKEPEAASKTVEYAYDDWTIARMAKAWARTMWPRPSRSAPATGATAST